MNIIPLNNYVVLSVEKIKEKPESTIYTGKKEERVKYVVVSPEAFQISITDKYLPLRWVRVGESVLFEKEKGHLNGNFVLVNKKHIIGIVEEDK